MKLKIERHPEYEKLAQYFKKIEAIAEKMGIEVDDLINETRKTKSAMYTSFKRGLIAMAQKRADALSKVRNSGTAGEAPFVGMTILQFNKENRN